MHSDPYRKKNQSMEELVNEFLEDSVNAIGITMFESAIIVLYEVIYKNEDKKKQKLNYDSSNLIMLKHL